MITISHFLFCAGASMLESVRLQAINIRIPKMTTSVYLLSYYREIFPASKSSQSSLVNSTYE